MPVLHLNEDEVKSLLTMDMAIEAVETGLRKMALEEAVHRSAIALPDRPRDAPRPAGGGEDARRHRLQGLRDDSNRARASTSRSTTARPATCCRSCKRTYLGQMRTGAASAVATKHLARKDASTVGIFGSGKQARTQLLGVSQVRKLTRAVVYSPIRGEARFVCARMTSACGVEVDRRQHARRGRPRPGHRSARRRHRASRSCFGAWLSPGQHINAAGSNFLAKAEIDVEVVKRANVVTIDSKDQGRLEAGDFVAALDQGVLEWIDVAELGRVVAMRSPGRQSPDDITLFKSLGIGLEDIAVAIKVYHKAKEAGVGRWLEV